MVMDDDEIEEGMLIEEEEEEEEDASKESKSPYDELKESKGAVEDLVAQLLAIKREGKSKADLRELATQMFLHFVSLRQANRSILLEEDRVKAETERAKAPVDFTTLQLHNLMYEKTHYVKAIKACKDFKSKYPDIELVPEEEFFRDAPEDIKAPTLSNDSAHDLMLKRLNYELYQRKELCKLREKLEEQKKSLMDTIANRNKFLSSLPSHLKSLKKASLPVQNQLGVLHTKKLKQQQSAELLPPPLYVVYSQLLAQKEAFGEMIDMEILGSVKDAQAFARQQAKKDTGMSTNAESSRIEDDVPDDEDDGQRKRRRPKKAPGKESLDDTGVYQLHPLKVILHIYDDEASDPKSPKLVTLKFEYLIKLNVVCVGIEGSQDGPESNVLCNLFPDDTGLELPHQSAKLIVGDAFVFDERRSSRPYKWVQHLAGIDFLPEVSPLLTVPDSSVSETAKTDAVVSGLSIYRQQNRVHTVVQRIRARKKAQLALVEQLDSLGKKKWPSLTCESVPWAAPTPSCKLDSWVHIEPLPKEHRSLLTVNDAEPREPMIIDVDQRSGTSKENLETLREDGELPSQVSVASAANDVKLTPTRGSNSERSRQLALISKSTISPANKSRSHSFKRRDEDFDLMLDNDSDLDEPAQTDPDTDDFAALQRRGKAESLWVDYAAREFCLVLSKRMDTNEMNAKLEAKIKISMEYPLRPPLFALSLYSATGEGNHSKGEIPEWFNQLRAMEAEVNLHILKTLPFDQENYILAHQVRCLAMLFDYYIDEVSPSSEKRKSTSVVDVGLCKPVSGRILARSFRGRDRRKMMSWKDGQCTPGYPY